MHKLKMSSVEGISRGQTLPGRRVLSNAFVSIIRMWYKLVSGYNYN